MFYWWTAEERRSELRSDPVWTGSDLNDDLPLQQSVVILNVSRVLGGKRKAENKRQTNNHPSIHPSLP